MMEMEATNTDQSALTEGKSMECQIQELKQLVKQLKEQLKQNQLYQHQKGIKNSQRIYNW